MDWDKFSFVVSGLNRKRVLLVISGPMTPTQISEKTETSLSNVSHALTELRKQKLVKCINPKARVGKIYRRTRLGKEIATALEKSK